MTVAELRALLATLPGESEVVIEDRETDELMPFARTYTMFREGSRPLIVLRADFFSKRDLGYGLGGIAD